MSECCNNNCNQGRNCPRRQVATTRQERLAHANELIRVISSHGRRFFYNAKHDRVAHLELRLGRVYFVDDFSGKAIYTHRAPFGNNWRGFSHGGTLRSLVERMRDYITRGEKIPIGFIAPTWMDVCKDPWGYGRLACFETRQAASQLEIIKSDSRI